MVRTRAISIADETGDVEETTRPGPPKQDRQQDRPEGEARDRGHDREDRDFIQTLAQVIALGIAAAQPPPPPPLPPARDGDRWLGDLLKARLPLFDRSAEKDVDDWVSEMETAFDVIQCPEERRVTLG